MGEEVGGDVKREEKLPPLDPSSALETPLPRAPKERAGGDGLSSLCQAPGRLSVLMSREQAARELPRQGRVSERGARSTGWWGRRAEEGSNLLRRI